MVSNNFRLEHSSRIAFGTILMMLLFVSGVSAADYDLSGNAQVIWNTTMLDEITFALSPNIDFDMDGSKDIIVGSSGKIRLISGSNGAEKWMQTIGESNGERGGGSGGGTIVDDIDGDGGNDIFVGENSYYGFLNGKTGTPLWNKSISLSPGDNFYITNVQGIGDISGDNKNDVIIGSQLDTNSNGIITSSDNITGVRGYDGQELWKRSYQAQPNGYYNIYSFVVDDISKDGKRDVLIRTFSNSNNGFEAVDGSTGTILWNLSYTDRDINGASAYDDLSGDGYDDVILTSMGDTWAVKGYDGTIIWARNDSGYAITNIQDINGDGKIDVVVGHRDSETSPAVLKAYSGTNGNILWNKPLGVQGWPDGYSINDINSDGQNDLIIISRNDTYDSITFNWYSNFSIQAISGANGNILWTKNYNNNYLWAFAWFDIAGDLTGNNKQDIYLWIDYCTTLLNCQPRLNTTALNVVNGNTLWEMNNITYDMVPDFLGDFNGDNKGEVLIYRNSNPGLASLGIQSIKIGSDIDERNMAKRHSEILRSNLKPRDKQQLSKGFTQNSVSSGKLSTENNIMNAGGNNYARAFTGDNIDSTIWNISSTNNIWRVWSPRNIDMNDDGITDKAITIGNTIYLLEDVTLDKTKPAVKNLTSDKSYVNNKWDSETINPPIKIMANVTDNLELQEVTIVFVNNQTGIIPFVWNLTGQGVGNAYNYSWNATQWEISNATKNISSAIVFNMESPDSNLSALGELLFAQGIIYINSSYGEQEGFVIFNKSGTMHLVGTENREPYYLSPEFIRSASQGTEIYDDYIANNMTLKPGISTFTPIAYKVNLNQKGDPQSIPLEKLTFTGRPEEHFNVFLKQIPVAEGEYLIGFHVVDKAGNQNESEILNVVVDNSPPVVNFTGLVNNTTLRFNENVVKGEVFDTNLESAKLIVRNETAVVSQYDILISNNKFLERVEFAPDQNNTLELYAKDKAGNTNNTFRQVLVKNNTNQTTLDVNNSVPIKIDAKNETETEIEFISKINQTNVTFTITAITNETQIKDLNGSAFALSKEMAVGKIVEVNVSGLNSTNESEVQSVLIKMYYNTSDLDLNGDGIIGTGDLDENNMFIYWLNTTDPTNGNWTKLLTNNPVWVIDNGRTKISGSSPGNVWVKVRHLSTFGLAAGLVPKPTDGVSVYNPGSGGGGGGGGGGGKSGENASNIEVIEKYDMQISKDALTSYRFTHVKNPIMFVNITGNTSLGIITTSIEILKNTSTLVKTAPEGLVYKNTNIWVGTSGFATPKNIREAVITFRIDNAWMSANGVSASEIVLMKWDGTIWIKLETNLLSKDDTNSYFSGKTNSFSPFAITALKAAGVSSASSLAPAQAVQAGTPTASTGETTPPTNLYLIIGVLAIIAIIAVIYLKYK